MGSKLQRLQVSGGTSHSTWGRHTTAWRGRGGGVTRAGPAALSVGLRGVAFSPSESRLQKGTDH